MTGLTIGLFSLIHIDITQFYMEYIVVFGLVSAPIVGTHMTQKNAQLVGRISPAIAKIFSPFVLITLVVYLVAMIFSGTSLYQDRDFLLIFNILLIGVMGLILFSVTGLARSAKNTLALGTLLSLSCVTLLVNGLALSAIVYRLVEGGVSPNRMAILGGNVLVLCHLIWVSFQLFAVLREKSDIDDVEKAIVLLLPVYAVWAAVVLFLFPFVFVFK